MVRVRFGRPTRGQVLLLALVVLVAVAGALTAVRLDVPAGTSHGPTDAPGAAATTPDSGLPRIAVADLPPQARRTLLLIDGGGPYPYRQDDTVFANQEGRLPARPLGYYREYTVATPASSDRGPRRLIVGVGGDVYYTDDHYASFRQVSR